ncbi:MAG TPA: hypothetical protein VGD78_23200 [Chthoniobacterales bacterium]
MINRVLKLAAAALTMMALVARDSAHAQTPPEIETSSIPPKDWLADIATLKNQVNALQQSNTALQNRVDGLETTNNALQNQLAILRSNPVLKLGRFVRVDLGAEVGVAGPNITFTGANVHIVSGSGATDDGGIARGLGNLILGYDEDPAQVISPLNPGDRGGSHNLVIGRWNRFTRRAFGGLVAGQINTISNGAASVSGGYQNTASGGAASVSAGSNNTASGFAASVTGGQGNTANGPVATVSGGEVNTAGGSIASVSGGAGNRADGFGASATGGVANRSQGAHAVVIGGQQNAAGGQSTVVLGTQNVTDNKDYAVAPVVAP